MVSQADSMTDADGLWLVLSRHEDGRVKSRILTVPSDEWKSKIPTPVEPRPTVTERLDSLEERLALLEEAKE